MKQKERKKFTRRAQVALARRSLALRERIDRSGDADLLAMIQQRDLLDVTVCGYNEIVADWAREIREVVPADALVGACQCSTCTVSRGVTWLIDQLSRTPAPS